MTSAPVPLGLSHGQLKTLCRISLIGLLTVMLVKCIVSEASHDCAEFLDIVLQMAGCHVGCADSVATGVYVSQL